MTKYILVSGGVVSGIGKGVIASSTGLLLRTLGLTVSAIKIDPYMNIDAGTMSPTEHGEVYVLSDGGEVDLDLGNYERYLDCNLGRENNITTGKIFGSVIERERRGEYLGKTVQIVPHVTNEIQDWIERVSKIPVSSSFSYGGADEDNSRPPDVVIIELGGTVGDIESAPFVESLRQFQFRVPKSDFALIHVSLVPDLHGEQKTKPTQTTVHSLRGLGLLPDLIMCRLLGSQGLEKQTQEKISMFCHVRPEQVLGVHNVESVYHVPLLLQSQGLITFLTERLDLGTLPITQSSKARGLELEKRWRALTTSHTQSLSSPPVSIALVGKYTSLHDSYMSVTKALEHSSFYIRRRLQINWVESSDLEPQTKKSDPGKYHTAWRTLVSSSGVLVPGGFGERGTEGMILAIQHARTSNIPLLGICLGFQLAVIEYARHVLSIENAVSEEFNPEGEHAVVFMPEISKTHMGGTMRLGLRPTVFSPLSDDKTTSKIQQLYGSAPTVWERHRHRYEINPALVPTLSTPPSTQTPGGNLVFVGKSESGDRMQILELTSHKYFVGIQAHPEFCTRPLNPSPPFLGFLAASAGADVLESVLEGRTYVPPHPKESLVSEEALRGRKEMRVKSAGARDGGSGAGVATPPSM